MAIKETLIAEMEAYFGPDKKRIRHAHKVLDFALKILKNEPGDLEITSASAILHDIGIHAAEQKYGSTSGRYQEIEGPPIAGEILHKISFPEDKMGEVLEIIAHHHTPGKVNTLNFKILYDADLLVNLEEEVGTENKERIKRIIAKGFLTATGKKLAASKYLL